MWTLGTSNWLDPETLDRWRRVWAWRCGSGRRALTGELGQQSLVVVGPAVFLVDIWGLAAKEWESLVPAFPGSYIFCEKLRSGDAGERDNVSPSESSGSCVSGGCDMLSGLSWLFSRRSSLGAESWSCCNTSQSVGRAQPGCPWAAYFNVTLSQVSFKSNVKRTSICVWALVYLLLGLSDQLYMHILHGFNMLHKILFYF